MDGVSVEIQVKTTRHILQADWEHFQDKEAVQWNVSLLGHAHECIPKVAFTLLGDVRNAWKKKGRLKMWREVYESVHITSWC